MVRDVAIFRASQSRLSALTICTHYLTHSREQMSVISPVILSDTFAGTFLFKMELSIPLLFIFFKCTPLPLALIFHSFLIFVLLDFSCIPMDEFLWNVSQHSFWKSTPPPPLQACALILHCFCVSLKKRSESFLLSLKFKVD